jgi:hypothetical protein
MRVFMDNIEREIQLSGFDEMGEPVIQVMTDRSLHLQFEFMPPSDIDENGMEFFDDFDQQLSKAIGLPVIWDDRERFIIEAPNPDTIDKIRSFIEQYR